MFAHRLQPDGCPRWQASEGIVLELRIWGGGGGGGGAVPTMTAMPGTCNWNSFPVPAVSLLARSSALKDPISSSQPVPLPPSFSPPPPPPPPPPRISPRPLGLPCGILHSLCSVCLGTVWVPVSENFCPVSPIKHLNLYDPFLPPTPTPAPLRHQNGVIAPPPPPPPRPPSLMSTVISPDVLKNLRQYLRTQRQGHHTIGRLEKVGVERGSAISTFFLERTRTGHHRLDTHWNCFTSSLHQGNEREKKGGSTYGLS